MNNRINMLTQTLLGTPRLADASLPALKKLVLSYPWMAAARLLVIKKLQTEKDPSWKTEWEQSRCYFTDTTWVSLLLEQAEQDEQPAISARTPTAEKELLFEPYYTVDYFASQGIQYKPDENTADKFGQQLKSFTDWLKVMKRLPLAEIGKSVDPKEERKVEQMAGHSLAAEEVVTEAMAAVWIKQGNLAKAKEVYQKLSLLEPSKNAYFASKISELN
ncbi:MAG: hypothetical protein EB101_02080 [Chitinophagia bacterium]|nr:hypothetical protein [Chitinophagia bacterium]